MIQKKWNPDSVRDQLLSRAIRLRRPLSCTLELTCQCNFHCKMCYIRMTEKQAAPYGRMRTADEWLSMARQLVDAGVLYLNLTGGECTRYPGFTDLYAQLSQMGFRVSVMTNAGAYTDEIREVFRKYPPYGVGVTLYGGSGETYKAVTGDPQGLENALYNIRFFQSIRVPVKLNFTMIRDNVLDYPKVGRLCGELGLPYTLITDVTPHAYDPAYSDALQCRLSPAERACVACRPANEAEQAMADAKELEKELAHFRMPAAPEQPLPRARSDCVGSFSHCAIYWNGDMQTCVSMRAYRPVNPFETGFEAAWAQLMAQHEESFLCPSPCQACEMAADCIHNCAARRFEGTGSPHRPDPYTCRYTYLLRLYRSRLGSARLPPQPACG